MCTIEVSVDFGDMYYWELKGKSGHIAAKSTRRFKTLERAEKSAGLIAQQLGINIRIPKYVTRFTQELKTMNYYSGTY